ncbi:MAG: efflux RND transporter periplasmic adaptor subunit [Stigonema ocellatum SAG 48.90 = DSM 106950]|nr:efflux RND transporter periplasmic adaptor subunit [Stigonema ocellatum SAG 48.90 = DSM 106950]
MTNEAFTEVESEEPEEVENTRIEKKPFSHRRSSKPWLIPLLLGTGLGIGITWMGMRLSPSPSEGSITKPPKQASSSIPTVTVADAVTTRITRSLNTTGTVAARQQILVMPQTSGLQIKKILVDEGRQVKADEVLATLDDSVLQTQIDQAKAKVESDKALLAQKQAALVQAKANVAQSQANVAQARANEKDALVKLKNYQQLATAGAISREQFDDRTTSAATKTETVNASVAAVNASVAAISSAQANINSAQADVQTSVAKVKQLQAQLAQTLVRAPVAGIIAKKNVEVGDVTGTKQLFEIIRDGQMELQALVPEVQLSQVAIGGSAQITNDSDSRIHLEGVVREISPLVDKINRKAIVKINLPPTSLLRSGMFARAAITTNTAMGISVPSKAVLPQPDGKAIVFTLSGEDTDKSLASGQAKVYVAKAKPVQVGEIIKGGDIEITQGLNRGDRVVTAGAPYLKDGDRVQLP